MHQKIELKITLLIMNTICATISYVICRNHKASTAAWQRLSKVELCGGYHATLGSDHMLGDF